MARLVTNTGRFASSRRGSRRPVRCARSPYARRHERRARFSPTAAWLFTVAYEMLAPRAQTAEDVVQETWLRWADIGDAAATRCATPRASATCPDPHPAGAQPGCGRCPRRREDYGWAVAPEPLLTSRTWPRTSSWPESAISMHSRTHRSGDARAGPSVAVSRAAPRCSTCPTRRSPRPWASPPRRSGRSRTGPADTWAARRHRGFQVSRAEQRQVVQRVRRRPHHGDVQGLRWTCSRPTSFLVADGGGLAPAVRQPSRAAGGWRRYWARFAQLLAPTRAGRHGCCSKRRGRGPDRPAAKRAAEHGGRRSCRERPGSPASTRSATRTTGAAGHGWRSCVADGPTTAGAGGSTRQGNAVSRIGDSCATIPPRP